MHVRLFRSIITSLVLSAVVTACADPQRRAFTQSGREIQLPTCKEYISRFYGSSVRADILNKYQGELKLSAEYKTALDTLQQDYGMQARQLCETAPMYISTGKEEQYFCRNERLDNSLSQLRTLNSVLEGIHNVGDGGLDWVGVFNFPDNQFSQPTFFGQCACGSDWIEKQFDAHSSKWQNYIQFGNGYLTYHFIPRSFRDESLNWQNPLEINDVVLIDRYRLINLLKAETNLPDLILSAYDSFLAEVNQNKIDSFM